MNLDGAMAYAEKTVQDGSEVPSVVGAFKELILEIKRLQRDYRIKVQLVDELHERIDVELAEIERLRGIEQGQHANMVEKDIATRKQAAEIERLQACITEAVDTFTQDKCLWDWVHRMRSERGLTPLKETEERQSIVSEQADEIERLRAIVREAAEAKGAE